MWRLIERELLVDVVDVDSFEMLDKLVLVFIYFVCVAHVNVLGIRHHKFLLVYFSYLLLQIQVLIS